MEHFIEKTGVYDPAEKPPLIGNLPREHEACAPVAERVKGFTEAELGFDGPPAALRESGRCACCLRLGMAVI